MSLLCLLLACLSTHAAGGAVTVDSPALALSVDPATGAPVSLVGEDGYEFLATGNSSLFRLRTTDADGQERWISSAEAARADVEGDDGECHIRFRDVGAPGVDVRVEIRPEGRGLAFRLRLSFDHAMGAADGITVEEIVFPDLPLKPQLGSDPADDCILAPWGDGVLLTRRLIDRLTWSPARDYPGQCSMQFVALYDTDRGLSLTCRDDGGECKSIGYEKREDALLLRLSLRRPFVRNMPFDSPWYVLEPCGGSWASAAANYRAWAREQWWADPADNRRPNWLEAMPLFLDSSVRPLGNGRMFVPLAAAGEWADAWCEALGAPGAAVMVREWEHGGVYVMPDCFPIHPSPEAFRAMADDLHARGHRVATMVAGLPWTIRREAYNTPHYNVTPYEGGDLFRREASGVCVVDKAGEAVVRDPYFTWDGTRALMCPRTAFARDLYRRCARELADVGVDLLEFDQMNGGGLREPCYARDHGHLPGYGPWVAEAIRDLMAGAFDAGRARNADFALAMEEAGELSLPLMGTFCGRNHELTTWPAMGEGSVVVPAFSYVYHGLKPGAEIDIPHSSLDPVGGLAAEMRVQGLVGTARNIAWGRMLWTHMRAWEIMNRFSEDDLLPLPHKMEASQLALLTNAGATLWGPGSDYLARGELTPLDTPPGLPEWHVPQENGGERYTHTEPAVRVSAFDLAEPARRGVLIVNSSDEAATVPVDPQWFPDRLDEVDVLRNGSPDGPPRRRLPTEVVLAPRDVVLIAAGLSVEP